MTSKTSGSSIFLVTSALLWGLTGYLLLRAKESTDFYTFSLVTGFTALILSLHTILYILFAGRKERKRTYFLQHGRPVEAEIIKVGRRGKWTAWRIKARYRDLQSGNETIFKSDILRSDPTAKFRVGDRILVYLHPKDPGQYWMETEFQSEYL